MKYGSKFQTFNLPNGVSTLITINVGYSPLAGELFFMNLNLIAGGSAVYSFSSVQITYRANDMTFTNG